MKIPAERIYLFGLALAALAFVCLSQFSMQISVLQREELADSPWEGVQLSRAEIAKFYQDSQCYRTQRDFAACFASLYQFAERAGLEFDFPWVSFQGRSMSEVLRQALSLDFRAIQEDFSFSAKYLDLARRLPEMRETEAVAAALNAYLGKIRDPHTYVIPRHSYERAVLRSRREVDNLGVSLILHRGEIRVSRVWPGSDAEKQGLFRGQKIATVDGRSAEDLTHRELVDLLRRDELTLIRASDEAQISLLKQRLENEPVRSQILELDGKRWGQIILHRFVEGSCDQVREHKSYMLAEGAQGLVIDLRDNMGGDLAQASCVASEFLPQGSLIYEIRNFTSNDGMEAEYSQNESPYFGPLAVLVNSATASASEVLAGALQDHARAVVVGERTFGKGSFQQGRVWRDQKDVLLFETRGFYYLPSGRSAQREGIFPDFPVDLGFADAPREADLYAFALRPDRKTDPLSLERRALWDLTCAGVNPVNQPKSASRWSFWSSRQETSFSADPSYSVLARVAHCLTQSEGGLYGEHGTL